MGHEHNSFLTFYFLKLHFVFSVYVCRTLEMEELRKQYISRPVPAKDLPLVYPESDQPWIGRRIDYILYRESSVSKHCRTVRDPVCFPQSLLLLLFLPPIYSVLEGTNMLDAT